jgi:dTMP kinase
VQQLHGRGGVRGVLQITRFRRLYVAMTVSSFGDWLGFLATTALAAQLVDTFQGRAYATGGVLVFRLLPAVLLGPVAGAFADRWDRKRTMVVGYVARALLFLSIPVVGFGTGGGTAALVWLLAASFLIETFNLFWIPAKEATVPNIVPPERLEAANQLTLVATYGTAPLAAALFAVLSLVSGALGNSFDYFATGPVDLSFYVNSGLFLFAGLTVARIDLPRGGKVEREAQRAAGVEPLSVLASMREGFAFVGHTPLARGLIIGMLGALAAGGAIIALGRLFAETVLSGGDAAYGCCSGRCSSASPWAWRWVRARWATCPAAGPSGRRSSAPACRWSSWPSCRSWRSPPWPRSRWAPSPGVAYVIGITLLGLEVEDALRGRMFGLVQSLMRVDLLLVTAGAPFLAGVIDERSFDVGAVTVDVNGISVIWLAGGLLAVVVGVLSFRQMDDRPAVPLRADLLRLFRKHRHVTSGLPGTFVALEGGEGAGKSTQLRLLEAWLTEQGHDVVVTREPGATASGGRIRELLLDPASRLSARAEALLYAADRAQHVAEVVRPGLQRGCVVLTDRYVDSSLAYQGAGRELERDDVARVSKWATEGLRARPRRAARRRPRGRACAGPGRGAPDRIEAESLAFHRRVREGFLDLAGQAPRALPRRRRRRPPDVVHEAVRRRLAPLLPGVRDRAGAP